MFLCTVEHIQLSAHWDNYWDISCHIVPFVHSPPVFSRDCFLRLPVYQLVLHPRFQHKINVVFFNEDSTLHVCLQYFQYFHISYFPSYFYHIWSCLSWLLLVLLCLVLAVWEWHMVHHLKTVWRSLLSPISRYKSTFILSSGSRSIFFAEKNNF